MKIARTILCTVLLTLCAASAVHAEYGRPRVSLNVSVFYDDLAPYGNWYSSPRHGLVWAPARVGASWRPYQDGHWAYCDYGWTWVSDDDWGWATFHYGRWYLDPELGWVWVPGTEWAPAWVDFYEGNGYIGWAPLPPGATFRAGFSFGDPRFYLFVEDRYFLDPYLGRRIAPVNRNPYLLRRARNVTRFATVRGTYVNRSLSLEAVARVTHQRVPRYNVVDVGSAGRVRATRTRGRQIEMFRPRISSARAAHQPRVTRSARRNSPAAVSKRAGRPRNEGRPHGAAAVRVNPTRQRTTVGVRAGTRQRGRAVAPAPRPQRKPRARAVTPPRATRRVPQATRQRAPQRAKPILQRARPRAPVAAKPPRQARQQRVVTRPQRQPRQQRTVVRPQRQPRAPAHAQAQRAQRAPAKSRAPQRQRQSRQNPKPRQHGKPHGPG